MNLPLMLAPEPVDRVQLSESSYASIAALNHEVRVALDRVHAVEAVLASAPDAVAACEALTAARLAYARALVALHAATGTMPRP